MSKLLDMLRRSKGEIPDVVAPLIQGEVHRKVEAYAAVPDTPASPPADAAPQAWPDESAPLSQVRTMSLRVPAPSALLPFENSHASSSEQYRILRTRISHDPRHPSLIVITSPAPGDGKSVTAINTAAALALKSEGRVLLLDADLRKSSVHVQLGLPESPGVADVLVGAATTEQAIVRAREFPNLYVMSAGAPRANPAELLDSKAWHNLCAELRGLFWYVIIDSPPLGGLADYALIQAICDGIILVLRPDSTNRDLSWDALQSIPASKFVGVVLNCIPKWSLARHAGAAYYAEIRRTATTEQAAPSRE